MRTRLVATCLAIQMSLAAAPGGVAFAGEPSPEDVATAKGALIKGRELRKLNDHKGALEQFTAAYQLVPSPIPGMEVAREQKALGMLIEARATALAVTKLPVKPSEQAEHTAAREDAVRLANELAPLIPRAKFKIEGVPSGVTPKVTLDGADVPVASLAAERAMNPGTHAIVVSGEGLETATKEFVLTAGAAVDVVIATKPVTAVVKPLPEESGAQGSAQSTLGWVTFGAGASVGVGGLIVLGIGIHANTDCRCGDEQKSANRTQTSGIIVGLVGAGVTVAGVVLVLTAPAKASTRLSAGLGGVQLDVSF